LKTTRTSSLKASEEADFALGVFVFVVFAEVSVLVVLVDFLVVVFVGLTAFTALIAFSTSLSFVAFGFATFLAGVFSTFAG